ncbi:MAG: hypothetical protein ABIG89_06715 [Candidatus Woesearchaeota archaeon]
MDNERKQRLKQKGWSHEEVEHAANIVLNPKEKHTHIKSRLHLTGFWLLMLGLVVLNAVAIIFIVPLILLIKLPWTYIVIIAAGLFCGIIFNWLILEIEHLEHEHHVIAMLMIPLMTLLDVIIIYAIIDKVRAAAALSYNPEPVVFYFGICFIIPYFVWFTLGKHKKFS